MRLQRVKNARRNIIYGGILKVYQIAVPFLIRTIMIYYLGMEYVGLNSLFTAILQVLNLAELGVGSAMLFSMYKPIAQNDSKTICALMQLYKRYYRIIGGIVLVAGLIISPFLQGLIKGDVPDDLNLYILYFMNLGTTVFSYWLFAYKNCLLTAHQRNDISSKIGIGTSSIEYLLEIIALVKFRNYYLYLLIKLLTQILLNIITAVASQYFYPQYRAGGELDKKIEKEINNKVKDLFTAKIGGIIVNSVDSIVISAFLGLTVLAIYNNYYYILSSVIGFISIIFNSCTAGIGNSLITESPEKNYADFRVFTFIISWLAGFCTCCLLCLYQPFMMLWVGNKSSMFGVTEVICLCIYFFIYELAAMMIQYKDAAGIWHEDRFRPLITALSNLFLNLISVHFIGIIGVLLSTVISFAVIGIPWLIFNIFSILFHISPIEYIKRIFVYGFITFAVCLVCYAFCLFISTEGWIGLFMKGAVCCLISNLLFLVSYHKMEEFGQAKVLIMRMLPEFCKKKGVE